MSRWSLRGRFLWIASFALATSLVAGGLAMYWAANIEDNQMLDARLEHLGATVLSFVEDEFAEEARDPTRVLHLKTRPTAALLYRYQVWSSQGTLLMRSHEAPESQPLMSLNRFGFDTVQINGEEYRTFSLPSKDKTLIVQVAENVEERWAQVGVVTGYYVGFLVIPFTLVFGATWFLLRRSLHSIDTLAERLEERNPLDARPLEVDSPPKEILPILQSLDTLLVRYGHAFTEERKFTSVAAHELRTPLAGLRAHAQLAVSSQSDEDLREGLGEVIRGVDRASHLLDQLLDLARIESIPQEARQPLDDVSVSDTYQGVMGDVGPRGKRKNISFAARFPAARVRCHGFAFYLLLRNLVANAINYTPAGGRVEVSSTHDGDSVVLTVDDSGPGIPAEQREHAFERFNRLDQTHIEGVGLGLSIVLSVVELHHGKIQLLASPLGGLRVQVNFGAGSAVMPDAASAPQVNLQTLGGVQRRYDSTRGT